MSFSSSTDNNLKENHTFNAEVDKILHMVIHSIYTNKEIFLRELISNASDACDKLRYLILQDQAQYAQADQDFKITITIDKPNQLLIIEDNGIGMTRQELIDNLGTIANSGTQKFLSQVKQKNEQDSGNFIGQFGVGFYSAFMVADSVEVYSTSAIDHLSHSWHSTGQNGFTLVSLNSSQVELDSEKAFNLQNPPKQGTRIILKLKPSEIGLLETHKIKHLVKTYSDHIAFPIILIDEDKPQTLNSSLALWMRPKSEISVDDYKEFYQYLSHSPDEPWMVIHRKVEGHVDYISLLYIPNNKPYDLFHPDRKARVKLYIKRVFITDEGVQLIPPYLRFLRGIIDSEDLPLNISRETLQHNSIIDKIRKSLVNAILKDLKKKSENEPESFEKFWQNFGEVLKEGLCEPALEEKEQLLEVCRFRSINSGSKLISLDEYKQNMLDGQEEIFFLTGSNLESLKQSPQLEGFSQRGIDVLLLHDYVDDFWVNVIYQYKNKELKSITSPNIDLDKIKPISDSNLEKADNLARDLTSNDSAEKAIVEDETLVSYIAKVLGDKVRSVQVSNKLVNSPACLALPEGSMNARLEKLLIAQKQLNKKNTKILEINPSHPLIKQISRVIKGTEENQAASEHIIDLIHVIFDQARLVEGEDIDNPCEFVNKINKLLLKDVG